MGNGEEGPRGPLPLFSVANAPAFHAALVEECPVGDHTRPIVRATLLKGEDPGPSSLRIKETLQEAQVRQRLRVCLFEHTPSCKCDVRCAPDAAALSTLTHSVTHPAGAGLQAAWARHSHPGWSMLPMDSGAFVAACAHHATVNLPLELLEGASPPLLRDSAAAALEGVLGGEASTGAAGGLETPAGLRSVGGGAELGIAGSGSSAVNYEPALPAGMFPNPFVVAPPLAAPAASLAEGSLPDRMGSYPSTGAGSGQFSDRRGPLPLGALPGLAGSWEVPGSVGSRQSGGQESVPLWEPTPIRWDISGLQAGATQPPRRGLGDEGGPSQPPPSVPGEEQAGGAAAGKRPRPDWLDPAAELAGSTGVRWMGPGGFWGAKRGRWASLADDRCRSGGARGVQGPTAVQQWRAWAGGNASVGQTARLHELGVLRPEHKDSGTLGTGRPAASRGHAAACFPCGSMDPRHPPHPHRADFVQILQHEPRPAHAVAFH